MAVLRHSKSTPIESVDPIQREPEPEHTLNDSPPKLIQPVKYDPNKEGLELKHPSFP